MEINDDISALYAGTPVVKGHGSDLHCGGVVGTICVVPGEHDQHAAVQFESDEELSDSGNSSAASSSVTPTVVEQPVAPVTRFVEFYGPGTAMDILPTTKDFAAIGLPITELVGTPGYRQTTLSNPTDVPTMVKRRLAAQGDLFMEQRFSHCSKCNQLVDTDGVQGLDAHEAECAMRRAAIALVTLRSNREGKHTPPVAPVKVTDRITMIANCLDQLDVATKLQRFKQVGAPNRRPSRHPAAFQCCLVYALGLVGGRCLLQHGHAVHVRGPR